MNTCADAELIVACDAHVSPSEWDSQVRALNGGLFHSYAHVMYSARIADNTPLFIRVYNAHGDSVGLGAGSLSRSRLWPFRKYCGVLSLPALPVSCTEAGVSQGAVLAAIQRALRQQGVYRVATASYASPTSALVLPALGYHTHARHEFLLELERGGEAAWRQFASARRTDFRRAVKAGIITRILDPQAQLPLVYDMHNQSMRRREIATSNPARRIDIAQEYLMETGAAVLLGSFLDGRPLSAAMFGQFSDTIHYLVSGSTEEGNALRAPVHMICTSISLFAAEGYRYLSLGGARVEERGLYQFKRAFGASILEAPSGYKDIAPFGAILSKFHPRRMIRQFGWMLQMRRPSSAEMQP